MTLLRLLLWTLLSGVAAVASWASEAEPAPINDAFDMASLVADGLLEPATAIEQRREMAARLIDAAEQKGDPELLYFAGSLYHQGNRQGIAPFARDIDRARELLTRSALAGHPPAMAKLASLELDAGNAFEGNLWAQLYARYEKPLKKSSRDEGHGPVVALVDRGLGLLPPAEERRLLERLNAIVSRYGGAIDSYLLKKRKRDPRNEAFVGMKIRGRGIPSPEEAARSMGSKNGSGVAEYFVEFDRSGKLVKVWRFDAWPSDVLLDWMQKSAESLTVPRAKDNMPDRRITLLPIIYVDRRMTLLRKSTTPGK